MKRREFVSQVGRIGGLAGGADLLGLSAIGLSANASLVAPMRVAQYPQEPIARGPTGSYPNATFIIRTVNTHQSGSHYESRLAGIADTFHADVATSIGLIGMQEVAAATSCPESINGAECFARRLTARFNQGDSAIQRTPLGIVVGSEWTLVSHKWWELGTDSWGKLGNRSTRYLLEAALRHSTMKWSLRFYTMHLSHGDQKKERKEQTERLIRVVRDRAAIGDLPPVVVGDFNVGLDAPIFGKMNEHFDFLHNDGVDMMWTGRKATFTKSRGRFQVSERSVVDLITPQLSDVHNSPRVSLGLYDFPTMSARYHILVTTGSRSSAGTDANVFITLYGANGTRGEFLLDNGYSNDFERGSTSAFVIVEADLGELHHMRLRHDNTNYRPGWFVEDVRIQERNTQPVREWVFPCHRWLALDEAGLDFTFPVQ